MGTARPWRTPLTPPQRSASLDQIQGPQVGAGPHHNSTISGSRRKSTAYPYPSAPILIKRYARLRPRGQTLNNIDQQLQAARQQTEKNQGEIQTLRTTLADAQTHIQNLREELGKKAQENERSAANLSSAQGIASEAKQRAESLDATIAELQRTHEQEVITLTSRVETEAAQRLDTFKYDLARVLRVDYADFKMANDKPMTLELGDALRDLLAAIFDHLQKQGINTRDAPWKVSG